MIIFTKILFLAIPGLFSILMIYNYSRFIKCTDIDANVTDVGIHYQIKALINMIYMILTILTGILFFEDDSILTSTKALDFSSFYSNITFAMLILPVIVSLLPCIVENSLDIIYKKKLKHLKIK